MALAFVSSGAVYGNAATATATPVLPASIVAGNLLLALVGVRTTSTISVPSGWTLGDSKVVASATTFTYQWLWRVATGSDTAPVFTWTGSTFAAAVVVQVSGEYSTAPFLSAVLSNNTGVGATHTAPSVTATGANAALYIDIANAVASALTTPAGWTSLYANSASGVDFSIGTKSLAGTGSTSGAISTPGESDSWSMWQAEALTQAPAFTITTTGGVLVGGAADVVISGTVVTNGGVLVGGAAAMQFRSAFVLTGSGGALVGGAATLEFPTTSLFGTLPPYQSTATVVGGTILSGDSDIPPYTSDGTVLAGGVASVAETLPVFTMLGDFGWFAANTLPAHVLTGTTLVGTISSADVTLPVYTLNTSFLAANPMAADNALPAYVLDASSIAGATGSAALLLPVHQLVAAGFAGAVLTGSNTLPLYALVAQGFAAYTLTGANTLPAYQLGAAMSQAVAAAFRAWVLNLHKRPLTEYTNFPFNSFAVCEGRTFAAGPNGIFELTTATDDAGTAIASVARTGKHNFGVSYAKRVPRIYAVVATVGDLEFRTITGADGLRGYLLPWNQTTELQQRRIPIGRGPKSTYWQFEIINRAGADFTLDALIIRPELNPRRVSPG